MNMVYVTKNDSSDRGRPFTEYLYINIFMDKCSWTDEQTFSISNIR